MIVYRATNLINDKVYIGQTIQKLSARKASHNYRASMGNLNYFSNAIRKYGKDNFKWDIIYRTDRLENLNRMEQYMITFYGSMDRDFGYNLTSGGNNCFYSEESKQKISDAHSGEKNPMYGKTLSEETKKKISKAVSGEKNGFYGRKHSAESIEKMKIAKQNMSEKTKIKMSISAKKRYNNQHEIDRVRNLRLGTKASEGTKLKMRNSQLKRWALIKQKDLEAT